MRIADITRSVAFLIAISLPLAASCTRADGHLRLLGTKLRAALELGMFSTVPDVAKKHFEKHLGFKDTLVRWHGIVKAQWLRVSTTPKVIIGKSDWLFYADEGALDVYQCLNTYSTEDLRHVQSELEWKRDWLAARQIKYLYVVAPEKQTIYPEMMPDQIRAAGRRSVLDQITVHLRRHSDFQILDLRPCLLQVKTQRRIYRKYDTHWNSVGAFTAYREIAAAVEGWFPQIRPLTEQDLHPIRSILPGDLATMLGLRENLKDSESVLEPPPAFRAAVVLTNMTIVDQTRAEVTHHADAPELRVVVFGDSFMESMKPFVAANFQAVLFIKSSEFSTNVVESILPKPDLVIQERVERDLSLHKTW